MTLATHNRLILQGFLLSYLGFMGSLAALSFGPNGRAAILFLLLPSAGLGLALIVIAKLARVLD